MAIKEGDIVRVKYRVFDEDKEDGVKLYINGPLGIVINVSDNLFYYLLLKNEEKQEHIDGFKSQLIYKDEDNMFDTDQKYADLRYIYRGSMEDNEPSGHLNKLNYLHLQRGFNICQKIVEQDELYPKIKSKKPMTYQL